MMRIPRVAAARRSTPAAWAGLTSLAAFAVSECDCDMFILLLEDVRVTGEHITRRLGPRSYPTGAGSLRVRHAAERDTLSNHRIQSI
jgi:hypothetical protein